MNPKVRYELQPTANQNFHVVARGGRGEFASELERSYDLQGEGHFREACEVRYAALCRLVDFLPDHETALDWNHEESRAAIETVQASAVDHFLAGDLEMATASLELLMELDPEDHTGSEPLLCFCYVAIGEYALYDSLSVDLADTAAGALLSAWSSYRRTGAVSAEAVNLLRSRYGAVVAEFCGTEHGVDESFLAAAAAEHPTPEVQARQLWLQTECLWSTHGDFIEALRKEFS